MTQRLPRPLDLRIPWWRRYIRAQTSVYWMCPTHGLVYESPDEDRNRINGVYEGKICPKCDERLEWYTVPNL